MRPARLDGDAERRRRRRARLAPLPRQVPISSLATVLASPLPRCIEIDDLGRHRPRRSRRACRSKVGSRGRHGAEAGRFSRMTVRPHQLGAFDVEEQPHPVTRPRMVCRLETRTDAVGRRLPLFRQTIRAKPRRPDSEPQSQFWRTRSSMWSRFDAPYPVVRAKMSFPDFIRYPGAALAAMLAFASARAFAHPMMPT